MIPAPVGYQCPECVAEARRDFREGPGRRMRSATRGLTATKVLLVAMAIGFVLELAKSGSGALMQGPSTRALVDLGALYPPAIALQGQYWRLVTPIFLHAGLLHIAFNAWALWIFGTAMEQALGRVRFLAIFFVSGFVASAASYAFGPVIAVAVGASGAIFGVFGSFVAYNYRRRHLAQAAANLRLAMTLILLNAFLAFAYGAIDWRAHVGGFLCGLVAGYAAEGVGDRRQRGAVAVAGFAALVAVGVALAVWRTADIRAALGA